MCLEERKRDKCHQKIESSGSDCTTKNSSEERKRHDNKSKKSEKCCKCCCCGCRDAESKTRSSRSDFSFKRSNKFEHLNGNHCVERKHHDRQKKNCSETKKKLKSSRSDCTVHHSDEYSSCSETESQSESSMSSFSEKPSSEDEDNDRNNKCKETYSVQLISISENCCGHDPESKSRSSMSSFSVKHCNEDEENGKKKKCEKGKHSDERKPRDSQKKNCAESMKKMKSSRADCTVQHLDERKRQDSEKKKPKKCSCHKVESKSGTSMSVKRCIENEDNDRKKKSDKEKCSDERKHPDRQKQNCGKAKENLEPTRCDNNVQHSDKRKHHERQNKNCAKSKENLESTRCDGTVQHSDKSTCHDHKNNKSATSCKCCCHPEPELKTGLSSKSKVEDCDKKKKNGDGDSAEKQILKNLCKVLGANLNDLIEDQRNIEKKKDCVKSNSDATPEILQSNFELVLQAERRNEERRHNVMAILNQLKCLMEGNKNCPTKNEMDIDSEKFDNLLKLLADYGPKEHGVRLFCSYIYKLIRKIDVL